MIPNTIQLKNKRSARIPRTKCYLRSIVDSVGRTYTIFRLQTRIRRKDGTENFGGFVFIVDGFVQRDFCVVGFCVLI